MGNNSHLCVSSLSLCSLELRATMTHLLPHVLQRMGQVSATSALALPVLEFLSGLIPIPSLYSGFVDREYLSVFAIALLYTDHQRQVTCSWQCCYKLESSYGAYPHASQNMQITNSQSCAILETKAAKMCLVSFCGTESHKRFPNMTMATSSHQEGSDKSSCYDLKASSHFPLPSSLSQQPLLPLSNPLSSSPPSLAPPQI